MHLINTPYQYTHFIHPINTPYQYTLSIHPINTPYQCTLSINPINTHNQYTLSIHPINASYQYTHFMHPIDAPNLLTLSEYIVHFFFLLSGAYWLWLFTTYLVINTPIQYTLSSTLITEEIREYMAEIGVRNYNPDLLFPLTMTHHTPCHTTHPILPCAVIYFHLH